LASDHHGLTGIYLICVTDYLMQTSRGEMVPVGNKPINQVVQEDSERSDTLCFVETYQNRTSKLICRQDATKWREAYMRNNKGACCSNHREGWM
jgi:hypothetical protein